MISGFLFNALAFVVALGILVAVHEWGHYYVAKLCKVKILRFSIGFGKPLYKRITSTGMEFVIAAIPLGGYVRMLDGRVDELSTKDLDDAFDQKPVLQRMAIVFAGPAVNFIFAVVVLTLAAMIGTTSSKTIVGEVLPNSYSSAAGLESGDHIVKVGGLDVSDWQDVGIEVASFSGEKQLPLEVVTANGVTKTRTLPIDGWTINPDSNDLFGDLGFKVYFPKTLTTINDLAPDSPAKAAGLQIGDKIVKIDGTSIDEWRQIVAYVANKAEQSVVVHVERQGALFEHELVLARHPEDNSRGFMGVVPVFEAWPENYVVETQMGPLDALSSAGYETWRLASVTLTMLGKLFTGDLSFKSLSGPISIAQGAGATASYGLVAFLGFLALISVNLGIINLLPMPILDGGHLVYLLVELVTGKSVPENIQEIGFRIGGALMFTIMIMVIFNDILRNT